MTTTRTPMRTLEFVRFGLRWPICQATRTNIYRVDCKRAARYVIRESFGDWLVCGYHRRGWLKRVSFPLGQAATVPEPAHAVQ